MLTRMYVYAVYNHFWISFKCTRSLDFLKHKHNYCGETVPDLQRVAGLHCGLPAAERPIRRQITLVKTTSRV